MRLNTRNEERFKGHIGESTIRPSDPGERSKEGNPSGHI